MTFGPCVQRPKQMHWVSLTPVSIAWRTNSLWNSWRTRLDLRSAPQRGPVQMRTCFLKGRFTRAPPSPAAPAGGLLDLERRLKLQAGVQRQAGHPDDDAAVLAAIAVELGEDLRGPLHHLEGVEEARSHRHVPDHLDHAADPVEILDRLLGRGEDAERGEAGRFDSLLDRHLPPDRADVLELAVLLGKLSRDEQKVPGAHALDVRPERLPDLGQMPAQRLQDLLDLARHRRVLPAAGVVVTSATARAAASNISIAGRPVQENCF